MTGVVLHYYGSPGCIDEAVSYYADIIHRHPSPDEAEAFVSQYRRFGLPAPLGSIVERIETVLANRLNRNLDGRFVVLRSGQHAPPSIDDVAAKMAAENVREIISLPLTPFASKLGTGNYHLRLSRALDRLFTADRDLSDASAGGALTALQRPVIRQVDGWYADPGFIEACAIRLRQAVRWLPGHVQPYATVVFTTHSMPKAEVSDGVPLPDQYRSWAEMTARSAGVSEWRLSYRSAPGGDDKWLGPDVLDVIREEASKGKQGVVVCPLPTLFENIEVVTEAGSDAQTVARELGMEFVRTELLNDASDMVDLLYRLIVRTV